MEQDAYYFRVGLFVMLTAVFATIFIGWFSSKRDSDGHTPYALYITGSVDGLLKGSPVKLRGIQVGYVEEIGFVGARDDAIRVIIQVVDNAPIYANTTATMQMQGLTGGSMIALDNTQPGKQPITARDKDKYLIITSKASSLERVVATVPELLDELNKLVVQGQKMFGDDNVKAVHDSLTSVNAAVAAFANLVGTQRGPSMQSSFEAFSSMIGEANAALREVKMLARTLREDPSIVLHGVQHEGVKVP